MTKEFKIEGMHCSHCVIAVQKKISRLDLKNYKVQIGSATIDYDEIKIKEALIKMAIEDAGYKVIN